MSSYFPPVDGIIQTVPNPTKTIKCAECFKPLGQDDAYGHDCEV